MMLEEPMRRLDMARGDLTRAENASTAWADLQRSEFDSQRMLPLKEAGAQLEQALRKASEQCEAANRLLD